MDVFRTRLINCAIGLLLFIALPANAQDWPEMNRYKEQNRALGDPPEGHCRVVFMGNSITEGWKHFDPELFSDPRFVNRGIGGQTTPQMLLRFRQDVIELKPGIVVILAGTNDIAGNTGPMTLEEIRNNIVSMTELAQVNGIKVILCSVLPAFDYVWRPGLSPNTKIPLLNAMLKSHAEESGIYYLDYFSNMADERNGLPAEMADDGVHPNKKGYEVMKGMLQKALKEVQCN